MARLVLGLKKAPKSNEKEMSCNKLKLHQIIHTIRYHQILMIIKSIVLKLEPIEPGG